MVYENNQAQLALTILRTCRQVSNEANHVLWSTNTFSFNGPTTFDEFMLNLRATQKQAVKKIQLSMLINKDLRTKLDTCVQARSYQDATRVANRASLHEQRFEPRVIELVESTLAYLRIRTEGVDRLQPLPLETVTAVVVDRADHPNTTKEHHKAQI